MKQQNTLKESQDKETQIDKQQEEDEEEKFVYPQPKEENIPKQKEEEEEEEEVFVYRGLDAVVEEEEGNKENVPPSVSLVNKDASASNESLSDTNKVSSHKLMGVQFI